MAFLPSHGGALGEELFTDPARVLGGHHGVAHGPLVREDLMVVPTLRRHEADTAIAWGQGYQRKEVPAIGRAGRVSSVTSFLWKLRDSHAEKGCHLLLNCDSAGNG